MLAYLAPRSGTIPASAPAARLRRQLVAFERIGPIAPAASATVKFTLTAAMATLHDGRGQPVLYAGAYELTVATAGGEEVVLPVACKAAGCAVSSFKPAL